MNRTRIFRKTLQFKIFMDKHIVSCIDINSQLDSLDGMQKGIIAGNVC